MKTGILLINLGTPDAPTIPAVRHYLREFLMDPFVIDIPAVARWLLVHGIILRFRPKSSAHAYQQIWTEQGSPLLVHSLELKHQLAESLGDDYHVELGMRYGNPSITSAVNTLCQQGLKKIIAIPLFPQYSTAASESAIQCMKTAFKQQPNQPDITLIREFYNDPRFIDAYAQIIQQHFNPAKDELLLMSYHGLPVKHLTKVGCHHANQCAEGDACPKMQISNQDCYRAQCYATSQLIAKQLNLNPSQYSISFQSRLGKTPWIKPYTDFHLAELRQKGIKNIAVVCPSFVADCLETLEEIGMRAKEQWIQLGGKQLKMIPCLNANPVWTKALTTIIHEA